MCTACSVQYARALVNVRARVCIRRAVMFLLSRSPRLFDGWSGGTGQTHGR